MKKPLFYRLFKFGKLPKGIEISDAETIDEGIRILTTFRNYKSPGKQFSLKKRVLIGSMITTSDKIIAFAYSRQLIHLPFSDERLKKIDFSGSSEYLLSMRFDVAHFNEQASGEALYEFYTPNAPEIIAQIESGNY